ncbi:MAG: deaminase [Gemmatimonadota bacterium]
MTEVEEELRAALQRLNYTPALVNLMSGVVTDRIRRREKASEFHSNLARAYAQKMWLGTKRCADAGRTDAMAFIALDEIAQSRALYNARHDRPSEAPVPSRVYLIHQLKRPDEVRVMRDIYGDRFLLVAVWASRSERIKRLTKLFAGELLGTDDARFAADAEKLVDRDERERSAPADSDPQSHHFGQNVRETFPLADFFVAHSATGLWRNAVHRFVDALLGSPTCSPSHDEVGMNLAYSAALRSASLARQVGAAICAPDGSVISTGMNEVPRPGGGAYWTGDIPDDRDIVVGVDASNAFRIGLVLDMLQQLQSRGWFRAKYTKLDELALLSAAREEGAAPDLLGNLRVMDILDHMRAMHAEQAAIAGAALRGVAVAGATLYVTTYPCHECARLILGAGIGRVVYVEPYAKSRARELYPAGITDELPNDHSVDNRIPFVPFFGVAPRAYRRVFEWGSRKTAGGALTAWGPNTAFLKGASEYEGYISNEQQARDRYLSDVHQRTLQRRGVPTRGSREA